MLEGGQRLQSYGEKKGKASALLKEGGVGAMTRIPMAMESHQVSKKKGRVWIP